MKPEWASGIEQKYERLTNGGILATHLDAKDVNSIVDLFNKEKNGANDESNVLFSLFIRESKHNQEWSHDKPTNGITNVNRKNHSSDVFLLESRRWECKTSYGQKLLGNQSDVEFQSWENRSDGKSVTVNN